MQSRPQTPSVLSSSRRDFLRTSAGTAAAGAVLTGATVTRSSAGQEQTIPIALVGCGGRGTGAATQALSTQGPTRLVAMADVFEDRLKSSLDQLTAQHSPQLEVPPARQFLGMDAYRKAIDCVAPGGVVLLATPPAFRPIHVEYAVSRGCHVFMEKSFGVDAPGVRRILKAGQDAAARNLKIAGGLMSRHYKPLEEAVSRIHDGAIGDVITCYAYRMHSPVGLSPKAARRERARPPGPQLLELHLAQRQLPPGLADPQPRHLLLGEGSMAGVVPGPGRPPGPDAAGPALRPLRGRVHLPRRHPAHRRGPAHGPVLGVLRRRDPRRQGLRRARRRHHRPEDLPGPPAHAQEPDLEIHGAPSNHYQVEHDLLFEAIRHDKPYNEAERCGYAALVGIMGRMAAESGKVVTWDEALHSKVELAPGLDKLTMASPPPVKPDAKGNYPVAMPGFTTTV